MNSVRNYPIASSERARRTMVANRRRDTAIELSVRRLLHRAGARYRVDYAPDPSMPRRKADIVFTRRRIAVFIDGCFWHGCQAHYVPPVANSPYWASKIERNRARDLDTTERLRQGGWEVLRFWEHEGAATISSAVLARLDQD